jgi:trigger factor
MSSTENTSDDTATEREEAKRLNLDVQIDSRGACQRHITVTVPRADIERYFDNAFSELVTSAAVPGFRSGRAPRKLIETRFRKDVVEQVKGSLLMDSLTQLTEDHSLAAISEPDFDVEVRPEFELPNWKGLSVERPVRVFDDADVASQLEKILAKRGRLVPHDGPASAGDYIATKITFKHGDETLSSSDDEVLRIRPTLSFRDGKIQKFDKLRKGVKAGETREAEAQLTDDAPNEALRGKKVKASFEILEVKKLELPELTTELLNDLGDFDSEAELRDAIRQSLERQLSYQQQQRARQQVLSVLTEAANWELPPELLKRQSARELQRSVLELRRSGFSDEQIRAHENELRQNSREATARALKEHFVLERIAEAENIEDTSDDYDQEIALIAAQTGESARRTRAKLEKGGMMDTLRNQIIERKAVELILSHAKFKDVPFEFEPADAEAVAQSAGGGDEPDSEIPDAEYDPEAKPLREDVSHD